MMAPGPQITVMGIKTGPSPFTAISIAERVYSIQLAARMRIDQLMAAGDNHRAIKLKLALSYDELTACINYERFFEHWQISRAVNKLMEEQ